MRSTFSLALLMALIAVGGCAQMSVNVRVLKLEKLKASPEWVYADLVQKYNWVRSVLAPGEKGGTVLDERGVALAKKMRPSIEGIQSALGRVFPNNAVAKQMADTLGSYPGLITSSFSKAQTRYRQGVANFDEASKLAAQDLADKAQEKYHAAASSFDQGDQAIHAVTSKIRDELNAEPVQALLLTAQATAATQPAPKLAPPAAPTAEAVKAAADKANAANAPADAANSVQADVQEAASGIVGNNGIFDDPRAALIAGAPDEYWKPCFNKAYGGGLAGNTDIAIKMESLGDFSLKGVRVDATKITQATFNGINMAVKLVASAYGIPTGPAKSSTSTTSGQSGSASTTSSTDPLTTADANQQAAQAKLQRGRKAALTILSSIAEQATAFDDVKKDTDQDAMNQAVTAGKQIKATFDAYQSELDPQ